MAVEDKSILKQIVKQVRSYMAETSVDGQYTDAELIRNDLRPAIMDVMNRLRNANRSGPILTSYSFNLVEGQRTYKLPPACATVYGVYVLNSDGDRIAEVLPNQRRNINGFIWALEGGPGALEIKIEEEPLARDEETTVEVEFGSSYDVLPHYTEASATAVFNSTKTVLTLDNTTTLGDLDDRENAFAGCILRVLGKGSSPNPITEERIISRSDWSSGGGGIWTVTVRTPFTDLTAATTGLSYEIVPASMWCVAEAIALRMSLKLGSKQGRVMSATQRRNMEMEFKSALATSNNIVRDMNMRVPFGVDKNTNTNPVARYGRHV